MARNVLRNIMHMENIEFARAQATFIGTGVGCFELPKLGHGRHVLITHATFDPIVEILQ